MIKICDFRCECFEKFSQRFPGSTSNSTTDDVIPDKATRKKPSLEIAWKSRTGRDIWFKLNGIFPTCRRLETEQFRAPWLPLFREAAEFRNSHLLSSKFAEADWISVPALLVRFNEPEPQSACMQKTVKRTRKSKSHVRRANHYPTIIIYMTSCFVVIASNLLFVRSTESVEQYKHENNFSFVFCLTKKNFFCARNKAAAANLSQWKMNYESAEFFLFFRRSLSFCVNFGFGFLCCSRSIVATPCETIAVCATASVVILRQQTRRQTLFIVYHRRESVLNCGLDRLRRDEIRNSSWQRLLHSSCSTRRLSSLQLGHLHLDHEKRTKASQMILFNWFA